MMLQSSTDKREMAPELPRHRYIYLMQIGSYISIGGIQHGKKASKTFERLVNATNQTICWRDLVGRALPCDFMTMVNSTPQKMPYPVGSISFPKKATNSLPVNPMRSRQYVPWQGREPLVDGDPILRSRRIQRNKLHYIGQAKLHTTHNEYSLRRVTET